MEGVGLTLTNPGSLDVDDLDGDLDGSGTKEITSGIEFTIHSQLAILAEAASMLPHANIGEEDKDALKIKKDHETYCQRVVSLLKNGTTTVKKSSISTAILPRRQVGSGRNFMKRQRRFLQNGNRQSNKGPPHHPSSIPTQTIPSSIEQPEEIASTSKRKLEEESEAEVVPPSKVDEVASYSIPKTGVGHRWLRSKAMTNEDFINLQRARDTDISHERKRRRSGSLQRNGYQGQDTDGRLSYTDGDGMSGTADLSTSLQDPEFSMSLMPKAICAPPERSIYNVSQKILSLELVQPPKVDELLDTPPVEISIEDGDKPQEMEVDISASEFTLLTAHDEIKKEDDKSSKSCLKSQKNAWSRHFPFSLRLENPSVPECLPTPAKVMKYSAEFDTNYKIRQRVRELKYEGLWTATRLPKVYERPRSKNHWDYVLEEMTWMAEDFASEKRWKINAAKQVAKMVEQYHIQKELKQEEDKISPKQPVMYLSIDLDTRSCPFEDFLTYPKEYDSEDQTWMAKLLDWEDQREMPFMIYGPPTPPPDGEFELCEDLAVGYLYKYGIMEESELPRVYVPKRKMKKSIASLKAVNDLNSRGRLPTTFNPQSLFGQCPPKLLDDQNKKRFERTHRPLRPWEPRSLPISFVRPISASPQGQFNPSSDNWIAQEDAFLWETVRNTFTLLETPRLHPIFPGHCMNWKYMEDAGKLVGMTFKSQQKSFSRYQTLLSLQANKNTSKFPNLHASHSPINFQQDNGSVEFETLRRAKFQTILALRSKRRLSFSNLADQDSKVNLEQNKVKMEVLLGLKFNINYDKPLGVKDFPKKELKIAEQVQRQKVEVSTLAPSTAMVVQSKELAYKSSTSVAKVAVPPGPAPASSIQLQPIKMEVSSSPTSPPSPVNKVEIVKCGPLTVEVKTPLVTAITAPTTALPLPSQSIIVTPSSPVKRRESTEVKGKEIESHSQPPKPITVPQESIVNNVVTPKATNDAPGPGVVIPQPSALSFNRPSGTLVRPIQKVRPTQNIIRPPPPTVPATSSGLGQFVQAQAFTTPISTSPRYYIFRVPPGTTINSVNRELLQQSISNLSVSRLMELGLPVSIETATATSQVNLPQKTILNVQPRPLPTRAEDVKLPHLVLETGSTSSSVVSDVVVNSTLSGPKILVVPTQTPRNTTTTTISSVRANPPASVPTQPKPVSGCLATQIRQFGISQFLPKRTKTIRIVSEAAGVPQPVGLNSSTTPPVTRPLQVAPATSHQRQTVSSLFVCSTPSQRGVQQSPQTTRSGPQSVGSIIQASPSLRPPAATHVQVRRMPIISLQRLQAQAIQETPSPRPPAPIIVRNARNEKQLFTRPAIISQGRRATGCQPSLVLVRTSPPLPQQSNVPVADPRVGAPSGVQEE